MRYNDTVAINRLIDFANHTKYETNNFAIEVNKLLSVFMLLHHDVKKKKSSVISCQYELPTNVPFRLEVIFRGNNITHENDLEDLQ